MSATVYGTPARYGVKRRNHFRSRASQYAAVSVLLYIAPLVAVWVLGASRVWLFAGVPAVLVGVVLGRSAAQNWRTGGRYARGAAAEKQVVAAARRHGAVQAVFCGVQPGRRSGSREDIDVLLVMTSGLVVLCEVKHVAGGDVGWDGSNLVTAGGRVIPGAPNPIDQVLRQRDMLTGGADLDLSFVKPMVVCSGATTAPFAVGPVLVANTASLSDVLTQAGQHPGPGAGQVVKALRRM
jgi:Nuclease-related domain